MTVEALGGTFGMKVDMVACLVPFEVVLCVPTRQAEVSVARAVRLTEVNSQYTLAEDKNTEKRSE